MQCLRLCGEIGGDALALQLVPGLYRAGSLGSNELVLAASGVSRHHARFEVDAERAVVRDLGSKNGTFVNGRRVEEALLRPGDEVELGEVRLEVRAVDPDDAELGLVLAERPAAGRETWAPPRETTEIAGGRGAGPPAGFLAFLEDFVVRLSAGPRADARGALEAAVERFGLKAAWLMEQAGDAEAVVAAAAGDVVEAALEAAAVWLSQLVEAATHGHRREPGDPSISGFLVRDESAAGHGLVVAGRRQTLDEIDVFLPTLLRWILHFRAGSGSPSSREAGSAASRLVFPEEYLPGRSSAMISLYSQLALLAGGELPILILGETGVGKEGLARIVHASSPRAAGPFVALNCAAIPAELLEAELFGIESGAATGVRARPGTFRQARGGTLLLDEIGDMSPELQAKLLRALQEKEVRPVGGAPQRIDVRIVSATNGDLREKIDAGRFRSDLYYRLAGAALVVPALRERRDDVPGFVEHFLHAAAAEAGKSIRGVTVKALRALIDYPWPGNVRELEHELRRLVYLCPAGQAIDSTMLSPHLLRREAPPGPVPSAEASAPSAVAAAGVPEGTLDLAELEKEAIRRALAASRGTRVRAARLLGISRDALRRRIERYGLEDSSGDDS